MESSNLKKFMLGVAPDVAKLPETIQLRAFDLLLDEFRGIENLDATRPKRGSQRRPTKSIHGSRPSTASKSSSGTFALVKDLDLRGNSKEIPSLADFVIQKQPSMNIEFNAVAVYYLKNGAVPGSGGGGAVPGLGAGGAVPGLGAGAG